MPHIIKTAEMPLGYSADAMSQGDSKAMVRQDWSLQALQHVVDEVDARVGQLKGVDMGLGSN